jgi:DNA-binding transcriptional MocR family regulator
MDALGAPASPDEILLVNGSQEGMDVVARALLEPGDIVLVEAPTFPEAVRLFASYEAEVVGMPMDGEGIVVDDLPALLDALPQPPRFIYAIPTSRTRPG